MKIKTVAILLIFVSVGAQADSFTVIRDGKEYLCKLNDHQRPPNPIGGLECRSLATDGPFNKDEAEALCLGSQSRAPATCAIKAYSGPYSKVEAINLCTTARNDGPAECALRAYSGVFSKDESIELCAKTGTTFNADCAIKAYSGDYSKLEAIRICKAEPKLILRALKLLEQLK